MLRPSLLCALAMLCGCTGDSSVVEILQRREAAAAGAFGEPLAAIPIGTEDGGVAGDVKIYEGEEPVDAIAAFCVEAQLEPWFRKAITERVCAGGDFEALPPCARKRAVFFASEISVPDDPEGRTYPGKLVVMEDEAPAASVELFLAAAEKEINKNRTKWDKQHEAWEKNRTKNAAFAVEHAGVARKKDDRDQALREIDELDWLLDNHTLSEPMRPPSGWFRTALLEHVCGLPGLSCEGRRKPLPELPITVDGSGKPRGVVRPYEGDEGVDLAYLFGKQHDLTTDVFRESLMSYLCTVEGVSCTRTRAKVFSRSPADIFGDPDMRFWINFEIWEDEEPVDAAFDYARRFQLTLEQRYALLQAACDDGYVDCARPAAERAPRGVHRAVPPRRRARRPHRLQVRRHGGRREEGQHRAPLVPAARGRRLRLLPEGEVPPAQVHAAPRAREPPRVLLRGPRARPRLPDGRGARVLRGPASKAESRGRRWDERSFLAIFSSRSFPS